MFTIRRNKSSTIIRAGFACLILVALLATTVIPTAIGNFAYAEELSAPEDPMIDVPSNGGGNTSTGFGSSNDPVEIPSDSSGETSMCPSGDLVYAENGILLCNGEVVGNWSAGGSSDNPNTEAPSDSDDEANMCPSGNLVYAENGDLLCDGEVIGGWGSVDNTTDSCPSNQIIYSDDGTIICNGSIIGNWSAGGSVDDPNIENSSNDTLVSADLIKQLQTLIDMINADPVYRYYKALVEAVEAAENLLTNLNGSNTNDVSAAEQKPDQPLAVNPMRAVQAKVTLATTDNSVAYADTIKRVGDAMRALGISTTLGQGITTATANDLRSAINQAKAVSKYNDYKMLVVSMREAEAAIKNGTADETTLTNLTNALDNSARKLGIKVPDTGVNDVEAKTATVTTATIAGLASLVTASFTSIIFKKRITTKLQNVLGAKE